MKTIIVGFIAVIASISAFANYQSAEELYKARGTNPQNAFKAYQLYLDLAKTEPSKELQAQGFWNAAKSVYYVGTKATDNSEKKKYHQLGYEAAAKTVALLEKTPALNDVQKEVLAEGYFWYGANLGKWGEANGVASSLSRWPELQETMKKIIALKMQHVQDYGAFRILGRAFYKLPFPLGSNKKSLDYLEKGFENTKNGNECSVNGLNTIYLANVLIAEDNKSRAKQILSCLVKQNAETLNPNRIPETKDEQVEAAQLLKNL